jgi:hypothetical protein
VKLTTAMINTIIDLNVLYISFDIIW